MRTLQLHCNSIEYEPTHKEIEIAENIEKKIIRFEDIVTVFVSIEKGDNENTAKQMVIETKESMKRLGSNNLLIYPYAHLSEDYLFYYLNVGNIQSFYLYYLMEHLHSL